MPTRLLVQTTLRSLGTPLSLVTAAVIVIGTAACGGGGGSTGGGGAGGGTSSSSATSSNASSGGNTGGANTGGGNTGGANTGGGNTGGANTGGGNTGGSTGMLVSGPGHVISYAAGDQIGIDGRVPVTATFDAASQLQGYVWDLNASTMNNEKPGLGTNVVSNAGHTSDIGWGRWNGGTMSGNFFGKVYTYSATQGFHYVIAGKPGAPTATTGGADYDLIGSTPPTSADGSLPLGSFTGTIHVDYANPPLVAVKLEPQIGGVTYTIQTTGFPAGSAEISTGDPEFGGMVPTTGAGSCGGSCMSYVRGFFASGGDVVGIAYQVGTTTGRISGVAAFVKK
ncbi:MAG: hypothetical protein QM820_56385 [Minicystis sp.]